MAGRDRGLMRSLTDLLGGRSTQAGESSQGTRRTGRRSRRSGAGSSTRDAAEGSGTAVGRRAGRRSRRGAPPEEEEEEEDGADEEEEEDLGVPAVWHEAPRGSLIVRYL